MSFGFIKEDRTGYQHPKIVPWALLMAVGEA